MAKRSDNRAACHCLLHVESLEGRQLLSGTPLPTYLPGKPPALIPAAERLISAEMRLRAFTPPAGAPGEGRLAHWEGDEPTTVSVLLGNGDGSFRLARTLTMPMHGATAAAGDFNHDGISDLAVVDPATGSVRVLLGTGDGSFQAPRTVAVGGSHLRIEVGDFNRDGIDDLAIAGRPRASTAFRERRLATLGVSPPPPLSGETRRTQKGRAISQANYWFDVADAMWTTAKVAETEARTESQLAGLSLRPEDDRVSGTPRPPLAPLSEEAAATSGPAGPELSDSACEETEAAPPSPVGQLLAGLVSVDLPALERRVDAFFRQVDNLAGEATNALAGSRLTPWLVIGATTTAAYALVRRRLRACTGAGVPNGGDPRSWEWSWLSRGAVPPPWEKS